MGRGIQLAELLSAQGESATAHLEPSRRLAAGDRYRQMVEEAADGIFISDATAACVT